MPKNLAKLLEQQERLRQEIRKLQRTNDTRRKILTGVALLKAVETGAIKAEYLHQILNKFITRPTDREFLELPPLPKTETNGTNNNGHQPQVNQSQTEQQHQHTY